MSIKGLTAGLAIAVILLASVAARAQEPELVNEIVAQINNDIITRADYIQALKDFKEELTRQMQGKTQAEIDAQYQKLKPTVLNVMIEDLLLEQKAKELNIDVEADVNQQMIAIAKENNVPDVIEFEKQLKAQGVDPEQARAALRKRLQHEYVIQREVLAPIFQSVTDKERHDYYDKNKDKFVIPGEVALSEIFLPFEGSTAEDVEQRARRLVAQLRAGGDWVEAVQKNSPPTRPSRAQNGKMGSFKLEDLNAAVKATISSLKPGEITDPVKLQDGFQIIRLDDRKAPSIHKFEEPEVQNLLDRAVAFDRAEDARVKYLKELRAEAYIDIKPNYAADAAVPAEKTEAQQVKTKN
ncbi:MAG TPA: peptidyl-prolyl cis-trans isomerase [Blastocatellia bacterium]|nr:peptidyl-prolyl cis-trans isomerase [Blastocatellia bacterium]